MRSPLNNVVGTYTLKAKKPGFFVFLRAITRLLGKNPVSDHPCVTPIPHSQIPMKSTKCAIALGSNLGDSLATLSSAIETLNSTPKIAVKSHSSWYQTAPIGPPQPDYINACAILEVALEPQELLLNLLEIEIKFNRIRREKWGARTLDLDLLLYDHLILETPTLTLPHPRMTERAFVLVPLAEIAPDWVHPVTKSAIAQLLQTVNCSGVQKIGR